jgi:hypothetical protein
MNTVCYLYVINYNDFKMIYCRCCNVNEWRRRKHRRNSLRNINSEVRMFNNTSWSTCFICIEIFHKRWRHVKRAKEELQKQMMCLLETQATHTSEATNTTDNNCTNGADECKNKEADVNGECENNQRHSSASSEEQATGKLTIDNTV